MIKAIRQFTIAAGAAAICASVAFTALPAEAQSRRELQEQISALESKLADAESRLAQLETGSGGGLYDRLQGMELQLQRMTGQVEQMSLANRELCGELRLMVRELQLRDREYAQAMGLPTEFAALESLSTLFTATGRACGTQTGGAAGGDPFAQPGGDPFAQPGGDPFAQPGGNDPFGNANATQPSGPRALTPGGASGGFQNPAVGGAVVMPNNPRVALDEANQLLSGRRYAEAEAYLNEFISRFEGDPLTADAHYLRGESFFERSMFDEAASDYIEAISIDSGSDRAPDAMVRLAASLNGMGLPEEACLTLDDLGREYTAVSEATRQRAARARLEAGCS